MNARRTSAAALVATVVASVAVGVATPAYAKGGDAVRSSKACSTGTLSLKAKADDGQLLELEAELDSNKVGDEWTVTLTNDGNTVWTGKRITAGPSGSFSVGTTVAADATPAGSPTSSTPTTGTTTGSPRHDSTTTPTTGDDSGHVGLRAARGKGGDDKPGDDRGGKGGDDKPGDDKGGVTKPATGKHVIAVTVTLDALTCATELSI